MSVEAADCFLMLSREQVKQNLCEEMEGHCTKRVSSKVLLHNMQCMVWPGLCFPERVEERGEEESGDLATLLGDLAGLTSLSLTGVEGLRGFFPSLSSSDPEGRLRTIDTPRGVLEKPLDALS